MRVPKTLKGLLDGHVAFEACDLVFVHVLADLAPELTRSVGIKMGVPYAVSLSRTREI